MPRNNKHTSKGTTKYVPSDYAYLKRKKDGIQDTNTISREEIDLFLKDSTKIPNTRSVVSDAAWKDVLNEFKSNPNLDRLDLGNVKVPYGTGDRILGRYMKAPDKLQSIKPKPSTLNVPTRDVQPLDYTKEVVQKTSNKVNAYNYKKGRPFNSIEKTINRLTNKGAMRNRSIRNYGNKGNSSSLDKKDLGGVLKTAAPYAASLIGTAFNSKQVDSIKTNRKPILSKYNKTPFKSNLDSVLNKNTGAYQGAISSTDPGIGTTQKTSLFNSLLEGNTKAGLAEGQQENRHNLIESGRESQVNAQNAQISNVAGERNIQRYNDKVVAGTQAVNAGVQDLLNVDAQRQARNSESDAMLLKFAETADTGTMDRKAIEMGFDNGKQMLEIIGNPNINTSNWLNRRQRQGTKNNKTIEEKYYDPALGETGD